MPALLRPDCPHGSVSGPSAGIRGLLLWWVAGWRHGFVSQRHKTAGIPMSLRAIHPEALPLTLLGAPPVPWACSGLSHFTAFSHTLLCRYWV